MVNNLDEDRFHERKHPRLKNYDYATPNYYFITICTHNKECIFGSVKEMSQFGTIAREAIERIPLHCKNVKVDQFVVMPNHVHMILILQEGANSLSQIVGSYKSYVTAQIHQVDPNRKVWQTSFHDHVIRSQTRYEIIWNYIETNPVRWQEDCFHPDQYK